MTRKWNLALSLSAGLLGGLVSHWLSPAPAYAQVQAHPPAVIQAQSFAPADPGGNVMGTFSVDRSTPGKPYIRLESFGHEIWRAPTEARLVPLVGRLRGSDSTLRAAGPDAPQPWSDGGEKQMALRSPVIM